MVGDVYSQLEYERKNSIVRAGVGSVMFDKDVLKVISRRKALGFVERVCVRAQ